MISAPTEVGATPPLRAKLIRILCAAPDQLLCEITLIPHDNSDNNGNAKYCFTHFINIGAQPDKHVLVANALSITCGQIYPTILELLTRSNTTERGKFERSIEGSLKTWRLGNADFINRLRSFRSSHQVCQLLCFSISTVLIWSILLQRCYIEMRPYS